MEENGVVTKQEATSAAGFVVDTQPDLRVSRVLPWLLLGRCFNFLLHDLDLYSFSSQDVAADLGLLQREGVTHVLNVATGVEIDRGGSSIVEERVELLDIPEQTLHESKSLHVLQNI